MSTSEVTLEDTSKNKSDAVKKWKSVIEEMSFDEITLLEYNTEGNSVFRKMFPSGQNSLTKSIRCSLCETATMTNFKSLIQHIHGKKHMSKVESTVVEYLHPTIDPLKNAAGLIKIEEGKRSEIRKVKDSKVFINPLSISADLNKHGTEAVTDVTLNTENLRENMNKFLLNDLLLIEYRFINTDWEKLFEQRSGIFVCSMCKSSPLPHLSAIKQHMNERKHQTNIDLAKGLYHPKYSPNKDEVNKSEKNSSLDKSFGVNATNKQSNRNDQKNAECFSESIIKSISETSSSPSSLGHSQQIEIIPTSKQKSLTNIFRTKMLALNIDDLKKIEYRYSKGSWKKMLTQNNSNQIKCMLCNIVIIQSLGDIKQHIAGKKHQTVLDSVALLYHPVLANTKLDDQNPKLIEKDVTKTITPSTHSQSPQTMKSSDSESQLKDSSLVERNNSPETQNKNQTEKATTEKRLTNKSRIVCTIELEDSPERETEIKVKDEGSACVINPAAIVSQKTTSKDTSKNDNKINQEENDQISNNSSFKQHSPYIQKSCTAMSTNQSPNMTKKSQENRNQQTNREFEFRNLNQNKFLPLQSNETNESSFSTKKFTVTSTVDSNVEGLIGVEYVVKILHNINDNSLRYECCLCEVEVDGIGMQWHLKGLQHRIKYLERHFPTAIREFSQYKNNSSVMSQIVEKLAVAIEQYHGRDLPYECLYDEFRSNRHSVMSKVFSFKHASELNGPSFTDVVDKNAIDGFISNKDTYKNSEPDAKRKTTFDNHFSKRQKITNTTLDVEEHKRLVEKFLANTNRTSRYGSSTKNRRSRSRSPSLKRYSGYHRRSRSPISKDSQIRSKSRDEDLDRRSCDKNIWQAYRRQFDRALAKLKDQYRKYRGDPETHPRYDLEWKQFWARRTSELLAEGRDPSSYNFQPEWVKFFVNRMDELYGEAVEEVRVSLRQDLGLESDCRESMHTRSYVENKNIQSIGFQHIPNQNVQNNENYLGTMRPPQDQRMYYMQPTHQMYQMPQIRQIPPLVQYPIQAIQYPVHHQTQQQKQNPTDVPREVQELMQSGSRAIDVKTTEQSLVSSEEKVRKNVPESTKKKTSTYNEMDIDTEAITPVSVLRILTALEDQLGSLGPKVIELLSKALTLEKVKPNKSIETFLNTENCVFLETVREKLKGQLLTGVAEKNKVKAIRKAINDVTELLKVANEKLENELLNPPDPPILSSTTTKSLNVKPPNSSNFDKRDLASKLAAALAAQGRTDFTTEQLEQLVTVYSMINKKTQKSNATNLEKDNNIRQEQQQQKSLSDTLAAFMKSTSTAVKQTMNSDISQENYSNTSKLTTSTTGSQSHQSILKPSYNFGMLSNFDTSLNLNKSVQSSIRPSGNNNSHSHSVQNISGPSSHTFTNQTPVIQSDWTRNRPSTSNTYGQQASIPPLLPNLSYSQNRHSFGNQSAVLTNYDGVNERLTSGNRIVTRPNNPSQQSQGSGFNSQNNSQRSLPMGWSRQFGRKY